MQFLRSTLTSFNLMYTLDSRLDRESKKMFQIVSKFKYDFVKDLTLLCSWHFMNDVRFVTSD